MDIILILMVSSAALLLGFGLVMAIDLNKWINAEVRAEQAATRAAFYRARGDHNE